MVNNENTEELAADAGQDSVTETQETVDQSTVDQSNVDAAAEDGSAEETAAEGVDAVEVSVEAPEKAKPEGPKLILPLAEMTPEERFRATTRLIFLAPDVPPIEPRPRRGDLSRLDDMLDQRFTREGDRERRDDRNSRDDRNNRDDRDSRDDREDRDSFSGQRRQRRRSGGSEAEDDSARRSSRSAAPLVTEPQRVKGSTRLEAKKQRRRDGRDAGRRRVVITESEFLARRESVDRQMIVRSTSDRVQIGVLEDNVLVEHYVARSSENSLIGNVYLGRVQNVLPSMEAAFVDIGRGRNAVLYSGEVDWSELEGGNTARRIENALKPGDQVLVQVTKDPVGHKGARLTSQISLPGRYLVYVPGGAMNGISRKLPDTERARLKKILKEVLPSGAGVIVRTAAEGASEEQLTHDVQRLTRQWESIQKRVEKGGGPVLLHSEPDMLIKIIRDVFNEDFQRLLISGSDTYTVIEDYLSQVAPDLLQRVERYEGERDVFDEYRITEQIAKALDRKVWLPSGGSLVIDRTEAMTVVDVNTGKFVGTGGNLEETVTKNNLESAEEIVRQLRLRDIGGIIVIDFIDMVLESNRDLVLRRLVECLSRDRTKHQVAEVTSLGLVQMTRKKLGLGLLESFSEPCDVCAGRGVIVHHDPVNKHRSADGGARNQKRGRGSNAASGSQAPAQEPKSQTHAITDGAKNMLAQVAASTIPGAKSETDAAESQVSLPIVEAPAEPVIKRTGRVQSRQKRAADAGEKTESASKALSTDLLGSVLDALPEAPAAGTGRARSRRVSTSTLKGGAAEQSSEAAQAAQQSLLEALDATTQRRSNS
ncbi:Rne/Rng family ribonuclease [Leucobacter viscericola]|uniref:Ribonuclease E n=1 Tax=Leucobacter viscericola TaxID=2714935 RepID=A0A6G7XJ43_9MICO|nr:Rne/Rng family ribonuclease [Leucobacter viscericola]QIK64506.1 Rne/Rng family ribonuclease [Leucobacter viscericola]